jgi:spoIIIJ-associated protein
MESLKISAKTAEEAIDLALEKLGLAREEVEVEVVKEGRSGVLGLGAEEVTVKVTPLSQVSERLGAAEAAVETLRKLLDLMGIDAEVEVLSPDAPVSLNITGEDLGILIGRRGQTLLSLQHIIRLITAHRLKARVPLNVDVEGYRQHRYEALRRLALRLAERVRDAGRPITLEPMPAGERRIIHLAVADFPHVITESVGEGEERKVIIRPKRGADGG